ncbi:MAG: hypothetical protein V4508_02215 [Pseudomonadota bacterium]
MGLLDQFSGMGDDQYQGLLAAASQMLQQSGPSLMPHSFGQIAGGGLQAYMGASDAARKRKQDEDQLRQMAMLRGLQIQEAQGGLQDHQRSREQQDQLRDFYKNDRTSAAPGTPTMPDMSGMQGGPTLANAALLAQAQAQQAQQGTQQTSGDPYGARMAQAARLREKGFHAEADAQEAAALKFKDEFATEPRLVKGPDGKPMLVQMSKGGVVRPIQGGYGAAEKLGFHNIGGKTLGLDQYTGEQAASYDNTQSPDSLASNLLTRRGQDMTNARALEAGQAPEYKQDADGNWMALPKKIGAGEQIVARPVYGADGKLLAAAPKPLTESQGKASLFASRMDKANQIMSQLNADGTNYPSALKGALESAPVFGSALGTVGNYKASESQQRLEQSQRDFVNAVLRQESGASISPSEFESAQKQYFPQRGDSPGTMAQKAANRATAIQGMALQSGPGAAKLGVAPSTQPLKKSAIKGQVDSGYRFKGGNPADPNNWEKL